LKQGREINNNKKSHGTLKGEKKIAEQIMGALERSGDTYPVYIYMYEKCP
jgi:hypothetical protein